MELDHECSWTRRRETELAHREDRLQGAGVPAVVLMMVARLLGRNLSARPSTDDEYGAEISLNDLARGTTHDECFFQLAPVSMELKRALVDAVLALHSHYLETDVDWSRIGPEILERWKPGCTVRILSIRATRQVKVRCYEAGAGMLARRFAQPLRIDCSSGIGVMRSAG